jgi:hypothetical protein
MYLKLKSKSSKGKSRIHEHGDTWLVITVQDYVGFDSSPGPWYLIQSSKNESHRRWIHETNDIDFIIVKRFSK